MTGAAGSRAEGQVTVAGTAEILCSRPVATNAREKPFAVNVLTVRPGARRRDQRARQIEKGIRMTGNNVFTMDIEVRFRDIDIRGHVNNAVYFTYFENGRQKFCRAVLQMNAVSEMPFILAHTRCDFVRPITLNDHPVLQLQVKNIGTKSVTYAYRLAHHADADLLYATAESVQVCFDYRKNVSVPISKKLRTQLSEYLKRPPGTGESQTTATAR